MTLRLVVADEPVDDDPWPRAATVGDGSAFAAVPAAVAVRPELVVATDVGDLPPRRSTPLRTWTFSAEPGGVAARPVAVPHTWSRRETGLDDFRGPARYERDVAVSGDATRARVTFDALDYVAAVSVDGAVVARHEGGFSPVAVDVPVGRTVSVGVELDDPVEAGLANPDPLMFPKRKIKGVAELHDSRPGGLAVGAHFTPEWGVRWGTGGFGGGAVLHESGPLRIEATFVTATGDDLRVNWVVTNTGSETQAELRSTVDGAGLVVRAVLPAGASRVAVRVRVEGARPWSDESPVVYSLRTAVVGGNGEVSDSHDVTFGFRSVTMDLGGPGRMQLLLDGRRTYVRAANYIPGVWPDELPAWKVERDVALAKAAGLNSLGVHAGVVHPLADIADRAGLLVYQDFPLQWAYDVAGGPLFDGGPTFAEASAWLTAEMIYRFYNHPSVVFWCGHNEPAYQLRELFGDVNTPELFGLVETMDAAPNEEQLDFERADLFRHVDPSRPMNPVSGLGGTRPEGDAHNYTGSLSGGHATAHGCGGHAFVSEFGAWSANFSAAASPDLAFVGGDWPPTPDAEFTWYQRTHLYSTQVTFAGRPSRYPDFPTWCFGGQLWAGWHAKLVSEKARLAKWSPSAAHRYHFFVDHWGEAGAGLVDKWRTVGPGYHGLAAANRPVVAMAPFPVNGRVAPGSTVRLPLVVVNDSATALGGRTLRWRLAALTGHGDCWLVGRDTPEAPGPLQGPLSNDDQVCVIPRAAGETVLDGRIEVAVGADFSAEVGEVSWTADDLAVFSGVTGANGAVPMALFLDLDGIVGWTSFVVAPDGWMPTPGLVGPSRFRVTGDRPGVLRRRWTGDEVDPSAASPDQYLWGDLPIDVYDDTHVNLDGTVTRNPLPW